MSVSVLDEALWQQLHDVRLRGMVQADDTDFARLVEAGYVVRRGPAVAITAAGRAAHASWACLPEGSEEEAATRRAYEAFLEFDKQVKQLTTEWQLASGNARPDGYSVEDWKLIDRLTAVNDRVSPVLVHLGKTIPRFAGYRPRLRNALNRLEDGERQWLSGLTCDSYHTVWWQLHEDILVALGIARSEDPNQ